MIFCSRFQKVILYRYLLMQCVLIISDQQKFCLCAQCDGNLVSVATFYRHERERALDIFHHRNNSLIPIQERCFVGLAI